MPVDSNDLGGRIGKSAQIRIRNLIPGSLLATLHGDLNVSDPAVCFGDDVFEVNATALKSGREGGGFGATKPEESWMLPETECEFLRYLVGSDDVSYVENYISYAEKNNWFGEDYLLLTMATGKTIWKRQTKLALYKSESPEALLNDHASNASESSKMTANVLEERSSVNESRPLAPNGDDDDVAPLTGSRTNPYNVHHLNANEVPINEETPAHRQNDEHEVAQMQRPQNHQQQHLEQQHQYRLQQQYQQHQQQQLYQQQQQQLYQQQQQQLYQEQQQRLYQQQLYQQQQQQLYQQQQQQLYQQQQQQLYQQRLHQQQLYQQQQQQLHQQQLHQQQLHQQQHNQQQHQPHQGGIFYPPLQGRTLVYGPPPPPTTVVPYLSGFICHQQPWPNSSYRPIPIQQFPQPPQPVYFFWQPINNTESPPVVTAERDHISSDHITQTREDDQQEQNDNNGFVLDECIENIISTIETRDENGLRRFLFLLKRVHPDKLEEFNKIMGLMDFINAQLPM